MLWLQEIDEVAGAILTPASADASFRRYFRASKGIKSWVVMDAPPEKEDSGPFVKVAGYLHRIERPKNVTEERLPIFGLVEVEHPARWRQLAVQSIAGFHSVGGSERYADAPRAAKGEVTCCFHK